MTIFHYVNDQFVSEADATLSVFDLGVLRGYGVFDYVQLYQGRPFKLMDHLERLEENANKIELQLPCNIHKLYDISHELIEKNPPIDAGLRYIVTGGLSFKDQLLQAGSSSLMILTHPFSPYPEHFYSEGMRVVTTKHNRLNPEVKSTNYMPAIFAMKKAVNKGFHDALFTTQDNSILEGTTCNVFFVKGNTIITAHDDIVRGVTREIIIDLFKDEFKFEYRPLPMGELTECDEVFLTSSVKNAIPVVQIDDQIIGSGKPGPITKLIRNRFDQFVQDNLEEIIRR